MLNWPADRILNEPAVVSRLILQVIKNKVQKHKAKFAEENQREKKGKRAGTRNMCFFTWRYGLCDYTDSDLLYYPGMWHGIDLMKKKDQTLQMLALFPLSRG